MILAPRDSAEVFVIVKLASGVSPPITSEIVLIPVPPANVIAKAPSTVPPSVIALFVVDNVEFAVIVVAPVPKLIVPVVVIDAPRVIGDADRTVSCDRGVVPPISLLIAIVPFPADKLKLKPPSTVPPNVILEFVVVNVGLARSVIAPVPKFIAPTVVMDELKLIGDALDTVRVDRGKDPPTASSKSIVPVPTVTVNARFETPSPSTDPWKSTLEFVVVSTISPVSVRSPVLNVIVPDVVTSVAKLVGDTPDTVKDDIGVVAPIIPSIVTVPVPAARVRFEAPLIAPLPIVNEVFEVVRVESPVRVIAPLPRSKPPVVVVIDAPRDTGPLFETLMLKIGVVPPISPLIATIPVPATNVNPKAPSIVPPKVILEFEVVSVLAPVARVMAPVPKSIFPDVVISNPSVIGDAPVIVKVDRGVVPPIIPPRVMAPVPQAIVKSNASLIVPPNVTAEFVVVSVALPVIVTAAPLRSIAPVVVMDAPRVTGADPLVTVKLVSGVVPPIAELITTVPVPFVTVSACAPSTAPPNVTVPFVLEVNTLAPPDRVTAPVPRSIAPVVVISAPSVTGVALEIVKLVNGVVPPISALIVRTPTPAVMVNTCAPSIVPSNVTAPFVVVRTIGPDAKVIAPVPKSIAPTVVIDAFRVSADE